MGAPMGKATVPARRWARAALVAALVGQCWILYAPRTLSVDAGDLPLDKLAHFAVFAVVTWLGLRSGIPARWWVAFMLAQAVASEVIQYRLLARRSGEWWDLAADVAGITVGLWAGRERHHTATQAADTA